MVIERLVVHRLLQAVPPREAPTIEFPSEWILLTAFVSLLCIAFIVQKVISQQREREGQGIPTTFAKYLDVTSVFLIMTLLGTLAPYGISYRGYTDYSTTEFFFSLQLVSFLWFLWFGTDSWGFYLLSLPNLAWSLTLLTFYLIYVYEVIEYCQGQTGWMRVVLTWLVSQLPVLIMLIPNYLAGLFLRELFYEGPTFITIVVGLIIMRIANPKPSREPW